jgi:endothelin-converting enzyme
VDEDTIKKKGIKPLQEIIHQIAGMFSVEESEFQKRTLLEGKDEDDLAATILYLSKIGVSSLVSCGAGADDKNPDVVVVQCSPPYRVGLPAKDYYSNDDVVKKYEDTLAQIIENLHQDHEHENASLHARWIESGGHTSIAARGTSKDFAHDVVELEKKLAAASPDAEDRDDVTVSSVTTSRYISILRITSNTTIPCL